MLSSRALTQFLILAEELNFGRAAERLYISQPPLSQAIKRLEDAVGARLFDRGRQGVALTDAGKVFVDEARRLLELEDAAIRRVRQAEAGVCGVVRLGFVGSVSYVLLPELLARFRHEYPDVAFDLRERTSAEQVEDLAAGRLDLGIVRLPVADGADLAQKTIHRERMVAVLPLGHRLAARRAIRLRELARESFMVFPQSKVPGLRAQTLLACQAAGFSPRVALEAWQMPSMVSLVAAGVGVALLPAQIRSIPHAGVVYCDIADRSESLDLEVALVHRLDSASPLCRRIAAAVQAA